MRGWDILLNKYERVCLEGYYYPDNSGESEWSMKLLHDFCFNSFYYRVHGRTRYQFEDDFQLSPVFNPGSICDLGTLRGYIMVDGTILPCERVPSNDSFFQIGNIHCGGIDTDISLDKINQFIKATAEDCKNCWCIVGINDQRNYERREN